MRSFEYRLYPTKRQEVQLASCLEGCRLLYNEMLEVVKKEYEVSGKFLWNFDICTLFKGRGGDYVPQSTVQTLADRLDKALRTMIGYKKAGLKRGFPRFKGYLSWHSFQLRQWGKSKDAWLADGRLRIPAKLGKSIRIKQHRLLEGIPKTCYIVKRVDKWFAVIVCDVPFQEAPPRESSPIGIDVGLKEFLTDSNGNAVANPKHYRKAQKKLRVQQRRAARRTKGGKRRRKANIQIAKTCLKTQRQRRDFHFKTAKQYADKHDVIVVEDLNVANMVKNHNLAKSITDAAWSQFLNILTQKAESAGGSVVKVSPQYTSQMCSNCWKLVPKALSVRTHVCPYCGLVLDRDLNAAINILQKWKDSRPGQGLQALTLEVTPCVA